MTENVSDGPQDQERAHTEEPAEGATTGQQDAADSPRAHSQEAAEGPDDATAVS